MLISESPTLWVLIKANTYSKKKKCDFILLHLSIGYCNHLKAILKKVMVEDTPNFYCFNVWDTPLGWFIHDGEGIAGHLSDKELSWCFITFDSHDELLHLKKLTQRFKEEYLSFFKSGTAMFQAYEEGSNEDYHSVEFPLYEIISILEHGREND